MKLNLTRLTILNRTCPSSSVNRTSTVAGIQSLEPSSQKNYILVLNVSFLFMLQYFKKPLPYFSINCKNLFFSFSALMPQRTKRTVSLWKMHYLKTRRKFLVYLCEPSLTTLRVRKMNCPSVLVIL